VPSARTSTSVREDLYFRINVFPVTVPPLRARREDVDALVDFFLQRFARELARPGLRISDAGRVVLRAYDWPGNIRELQNCIERAAILCDGNVIEARDLQLGNVSTDEIRDALDLTGSLDEATARTTRLVERIKISEALKRFPTRNEAADALGISVRTLNAKMRELEIE
jgi:DNA-binding NtrC family response regulator